MTDGNHLRIKRWLHILSPKELTKISPEKHPKMDPIGSESAGNFSIYIYEINVIYNRL